MTDTIFSRPYTRKGRDNWDRIFGKPPKIGGYLILCKQCRKVTYSDTPEYECDECRHRRNDQNYVPNMTMIASPAVIVKDQTNPANHAAKLITAMAFVKKTDSLIAEEPHDS